ncbi:MAG: O-antigen ligase family protein [Gammaproteobacteria bacterium]
MEHFQGNRTTETREWWRAPFAGATAGDAPRPVAAQSSKLSFWALVAFTLILILAPQDHIYALRPLHLALVSAVVAGGMYLLDRFRYGADSATRNSGFTWAAALAAWAIITVPFSLWPGGSVNVITGIFLRALIIFWLLGHVVDTSARLKIIAWTLSLSSVFLSLSAVKTFFTAGGFQNQALSHGWERTIGYQGGLTSNPNDLALILCLILSLTIGLAFCTRRSALRIALYIMSLLDVIAIMTTYSRGGFLMLATILLAYAVCLWRRGNHGVVIAFLALVIVAIPMLPGGYTHRLQTIGAIHEDKTHSAQQRWRDMKDAARYSLHHPVIGVGIGMSQLKLNEIRGPTWRKVHDVYLQYSMDLGWPGLILFLLLLYGALKDCRRACKVAARQAGEGDLYFLAQAIGISLAGFAVAAVFYPNAYSFDFFYFAGLAIAAKTISSRVAMRSEPDRDFELENTRAWPLRIKKTSE